MKSNRIAFFAIVISILAIVFSLLRITPFEFSNDIYIRLIASFIGISVTLLIGFQIINTLEIRKEISEQKILSKELKLMNIELNSTIDIQKNEMQEGFGIINTLIQYQEDGSRISIVAFTSLHHVLVSSLKTNRKDYEWIFFLLRKYISDIKLTYIGGISQFEGNRYVCNNPSSINHNRDIKDIVSEYTDKVDEDEMLIRNDESFCRIQIEYDRVMKLYRKRIFNLLEDPIRQLTYDEKNAIRNPN